MSDAQAIHDANQAFYTAFAARDMAKMELIWAAEAPICCIHPGWAPLLGRRAVIESWAAILSDPGGLDISCGDARIIEQDHGAMVVCREIMPQGQLLASNLFVRENGAWRLVHHHAGPAPQLAAAIATPPDGAVVH